MNDQPQPESTPPKSDFLSRNTLLLLLVICLAAVGVVAYLALRPGDTHQERIIELIEAPAPREVDVNIWQVIDAVDDPDVQAREGYRYKVLIEDEAREGASGIARIGGLVTFVPDTQRGDVVIAEVSRLRRSTADAVLIERLESGVPVPDRRPRRPDRPERTREPSVTELGRVYRGTVTDMGRDGDGIVRVEGKVVFVEGAELGEHVEFVIVDDLERFARAEVVSKSDEPFDAPVAPEEAPRPVRETPVTIGEEHEVTVTEPDRRNPEVDGVARIDGFVVFVPDTQPGDRVRIRVIDTRARSANAEVLERLEQD